jgi:hypothetical protein
VRLHQLALTYPGSALDPEVRTEDRECEVQSTSVICSKPSTEIWALASVTSILGAQSKVDF